MVYLKHWIARGLCLILLPLIVYMISFKLHFLILNQSGPGDAQMSSLFQANLEGNDFAKNPLRELDTAVNGFPNADVLSRGRVWL